MPGSGGWQWLKMSQCVQVVKNADSILNPQWWQDHGRDCSPVLGTKAVPQILSSVLGPSKKDVEVWEHVQCVTRSWRRVWRTGHERISWGKRICLDWRKGVRGEMSLLWKEFGMGCKLVSSPKKQWRSSLRLHQGRFRWDMRNNFFTSSLGSLVWPTFWGSHCPWKDVKALLLWSWGTWYSGDLAVLG